MASDCESGEKTMKILVTGGAGYIGSILTSKLLEHGYEVDVLDSLVFGGQSLLQHFYNPAFSLIVGSIASVKKSMIVDYDAVLHLAALAFTQGEYMADRLNDVNFECTKNIVELCKKYKKKLILSSTCSNYGVSSHFLANEQSPLHPTNAYARSKVNAEQYILKNYPSAVIIRFATVFGLSPRMRFDTTINEFVLNAVSTGYLSVYNYDSWRPYIHIDDATNAFLFFLQEKHKGVYNVGDNKMNYTKRDVCDVIKKYVPALNVELIKEVNEPRDYQVSFNKLNDVGFRAKRTIEEGVTEIKQALDNHIFENPSGAIHNNFKTYQRYYSE